MRREDLFDVYISELLPQAPDWKLLIEPPLPSFRDRSPMPDFPPVAETVTYESREIAVRHESPVGPFFTRRWLWVRRGVNLPELEGVEAVGPWPEWPLDAEERKGRQRMIEELQSYPTPDRVESTRERFTPEQARFLGSLGRPHPALSPRLGQIIAEVDEVCRPHYEAVFRAQNKAREN